MVVAIQFNGLNSTQLKLDVVRFSNMGDGLNKLLVRNLSPELNEDDKVDLLKVFGATDVICFDRKSKLKNAAFATFDNTAACNSALKRLHQLEILGCKLRVEYAGDAYERLASTQENSSVTKNGKKNKSGTKAGQEDETDAIPDAIAPKLGIHHSFPKHLSYLYPPATVTTLTNIANALASVPRFYVQVLHLMNKMNLPPPFTGPTITPPLPDDTVTLIDACVDTSDLTEFASSDESEIESDAENRLDQKLFGESGKSNLEPPRKKKRLRPANIISGHQKMGQQQKNVEEAFEQPQQVTLKRIEFKLAANIAASLNSLAAANHSPQEERTVHEDLASKKKPDLKMAGFGVFEPSKDAELSSDSEEESSGGNIISSEDIKARRMSGKDLNGLPQMKNYNQGERTNRLYIKNLAKPTSQEDLEFIFKRFIRHCDDSEKEEFQIRLMQEGRMKGQSFVTFPSEYLAEKALKKLHGFVLHDKPMIIQYGRATKSKD